MAELSGLQMNTTIAATSSGRGETFARGAGHYVGWFKAIEKGLERHRVAAIEELAAEIEEFAVGGDAADLVNEQNGFRITRRGR